MTHNDLVTKLQTMIAATTRGRDRTTTALLFGVLFNDEITKSGTTGSSIAKAAGVSDSDVTDGQSLARLGFVEPTATMVTRWKQHP